ncbi:MAG: hypothetical protein QM778_01880 [Myxococcales bacterium]
MTQSPPQEPLDPIESAWAELEANWDDDQAHRRFIALCVTQGALPTAGQRYRHVRDSDPSRSQVASRQIEAVMAAALSTLDLSRSPPPKGRQRLQWIAFGLSAFFVLYTLLSILRARAP